MSQYYYPGFRQSLMLHKDRQEGRKQHESFHEPVVALVSPGKMPAIAGSNVGNVSYSRLFERLGFGGKGLAKAALAAARVRPTGRAQP